MVSVRLLCSLARQAELCDAIIAAFDKTGYDSAEWVDTLVGMARDNELDAFLQTISKQLSKSLDGSTPIDLTCPAVSSRAKLASARAYCQLLN